MIDDVWLLCSTVIAYVVASTKQEDDIPEFYYFVHLLAKFCNRSWVDFSWHLV